MNPVNSLAVGLILCGCGASQAQIPGHHVTANRLCASLALQVGQLPGPHFVASYPSEGIGPSVPPQLAQTAFVYDNALVAIALVSCGDVAHAIPIGKALSLAVRSDRKFQDGRLRNAYRAGPASSPPLLPGWWDSASQRWLEDPAQDGTSTGNVAWGALALLTLHDATDEAAYLADAECLVSWIADQARGRHGYSGGFHGFDDDAKLLTWESTEHNADVYAAAHWLDRITREPRYRIVADRARSFLMEAFHKHDRHFDLGTKPDGERADPNALALDVQLWPWMAVTDAPLQWRDALHFAEAHLRVGTGFDFNGDKDGIWVEGTAQAALAYKLVGDRHQSDELLDSLESDVSASGLLNATRSEKLSTGLSIDPTKAIADLFYFRRPHIGATAWAALAATGWNPFTGRLVQ